MGKHNGKARNSGLRVGQALIRRNAGKVSLVLWGEHVCCRRREGAPLSTPCAERACDGCINGAASFPFVREVIPVPMPTSLPTCPLMQGGGERGARLHTTDYAPGGENMQSVLERNDLDELLAMVG